MEVFAFEVSILGDPDSVSTINAKSRGQAKSRYYTDLIDVLPELSFTELRTRKIGPPVTTKAFQHTAAYRGMPNVKCGQKVRVGDSLGVIVGSNCSANFDVLFDESDRDYPGKILNVHPAGLELVDG